MPTRWIDTEPLQPPYDMGLDGNGRPQWGFNLLVTKEPSATFGREVVALLVAAGVGTFVGAAATIFLSTKSAVPDGDGPFVSVIASGGAPPIRTHNSVAFPPYERPTAQLVARAATAPLAEQKARAVYAALVGVRDANVVAA